MKRFTSSLIAVVLLAVFTLLDAQKVAPKEEGEAIREQLRFRVSPNQNMYRRGEKVIVSVSISNEGPRPVYVPRDLGLCPTYWGGVHLTMVDSRGREAPQPSCGDPYRLGPTPQDALKSLMDNLVLLGPGYSYSLAVTVKKAPSLPGQYTLAATLVPPSLTEESKAAMQALRYPVFLGELRARTRIVRDE